MVSIENIKETDLKKLKRHGFEFAKTKNKTEQARMTGPATLVLYKTGKLLIQGKEADKVRQMLSFLKPRGYSGVAIGSDEALKGDTFGGIVVAAFKADDELRQKLEEIGVKDSKQMLRPECVKVANALIDNFPDSFHIENLYPADYNKFNQRMNVTEILDMMHEKCYKKLAKKTHVVHIIDLYPGCGVGTIKETKAESRYLEVAAASIIARYYALMQIRDLEQKAGFFIPLGSTHVDSALLELRKKSLNPNQYVKMSFRNVQAFFAR